MQFRSTLWLVSALCAALPACVGHVDGTAPLVGSGPNASGGGGPSGGTTGVGAGEGGGPSVAMGIALPGSPQYYRFVRLTNAQWAASVVNVLQLAAPPGLESSFEQAVSGTTDFNNNELLLDVNQRSWTDFQAAAEALADQVTASDATLAQVYSGTDSAGFIQTVGRRAYRRPLTTAEVTTYTTLFNSGAALSGSKSAFAKGAGVVIRALLQSPNFLYRTELGATGAPLSGYELAAKLSLWLSGASPSDALLDSAATLTTADAAATLATTLIADPAAIAVMREFERQLLHFDRLGTISKINVPTYMDSLNAEYQESSYLFFDEIFTQGLGVREMLTSTKGFMGPGMAKLYGLQTTGSGFTEQDLGPDRVGFFSQLPYLTLNGLNADADPIHRGVSINLDVLCAPLGPPAAVIPPIPPLKAGQTNRQRITTLTSGCGAGCHDTMINPIGFAFEHFDGMGQYRDTENGGLPIDSSGTYVFTEGPKTFSNAGDLMQEMANSQQAHLCYSKKVASFALQRDIVASDLPLLQALSKVSMASGGSVQQVLLALVKSDAFRTHIGGAP
jgi:Protein of unknown function (DUF1592)/Protein of unknown function (DUF1588)/Protein of unknown function (DUF1595)/Protein of unknown function (DUF1585)/Protein of unknown function (DUF1587)